MYLELQQMEALYIRGTGTIAIGHLPIKVAQHLGAPLQIAYLSGESVRHIIDLHPDISLIDMLCLPLMIQDGLWVADKISAAACVYRHPENGNQYKAAVKATAEGFETYISTFHRCADRQLQGILKRGPVLRGTVIK
ncbi:hypothetical protein VSX64_07395 [Aurantimonas sp. C2-6-R+9]|uniref:hypothetical protein n=1 Tax=unclassified Aurantimonas TaxID=2638230 RepID=UPI002E176BB2|nr:MULTISPECIES: hypothetical protein [unclassified Aurantimonas]MEC5290692.1 hypothetical protein [Aurantimonas sp. C2-3-R2]MEC5380708.1 hypothetical protein [Aurantimonas sp. C2-6-R+9]MEC5411757.1 hypothetical protein [Aurantimonas sp. C2-4-R8]